MRSAEPNWNLEKEQAIELALARSTLYAALAGVLRPPVAEMLARLQEPAAAQVLAEAAGLLDEALQHTETAAGAMDPQEAPAPAAPRAAELLDAARRAEAAALRLPYERLHGHTARGKVSPYETEYGPGRDEIFSQAHELADIGGFYRAFGLALPPARRERADHASVECEFLAFLAAKEAHANRHDDPWRCEVERAERLFLREHLGRFGRTFALALAREADHPFYRAAGSLCLAVVTSDCRLLGVPPGSQYVRLRSAADDGVPLACGAACGLGQEGAGAVGDAAAEV